jgi:hypothetical protein
VNLLGDNIDNIKKTETSIGTSKEVGLALLSPECRAELKQT